MSVNNNVSRVAVVSSCQMIPVALRALCSSGAITLAWHNDGDKGSTLQQLTEYPVDLLILTMHVYQDDLQQGMQLIERLQALYPMLRLMVVLDVDIPYLVSQLRERGVDNIISQKLPLTGWGQTLLDACDGEKFDPIELPSKKRLSVKKDRLSRLESVVMRYLMQGITVKEIAALLMRSVKTIANQKNRALHKMGISHYAQLVAVQSVFIANQSGEATREANSWLIQDVGAELEQPQALLTRLRLNREGRSVASNRGGW